MERNYFKSLTDEERSELKQNIFQRLRISETDASPRIIPWRKIFAAGMAAAVLAICGLLIFMEDKKPVSGKILLASTKPGEIKKILLADSSQVILNPNSSLYAFSNYSATNREVYLEGNGFFKVKSLATRNTFRVHANNVLVTVLGTQFNVNARSPEVEVALTSGKVELSAENKLSLPQMMMPGEKLTLSNTGNSFSRSGIDVTLYSAWTKGEWNFKNSSVQEMTDVMKAYYGVNVKFGNERTKEMRMTAVIPVTTLDGLLKVIQETLPVSISNKNQQLFIQ